MRETDHDVKEENRPCSPGNPTPTATHTRVLLLDVRGQLVEKVSLYQGTANSSVLRAAEVFRPAIIHKCPGLILCHNHPSGDPTPSPKDRRQFHRWLIGIDEDGIFINPELLARAEAVVATASNRPEVTQVTCYALACRPCSRIL
jgi:hypothetical protein